MTRLHLRKEGNQPRDLAFNQNSMLYASAVESKLSSEPSQEVNFEPRYCTSTCTNTKQIKSYQPARRQPSTRLHPGLLHPGFAGGWNPGRRDNLRQSGIQEAWLPQTVQAPSYNYQNHDFLSVPIRKFYIEFRGNLQKSRFW